MSTSLSPHIPYIRTPLASFSSFSRSICDPSGAAAAQNHLDVQREAAWALSNLTSGGTPEQLGQLLLAGGASALTSVLAVSETGTVGVALSSLQKILKVSRVPHMVA